MNAGKEGAGVANRRTLGGGDIEGRGAGLTNGQAAEVRSGEYCDEITSVEQAVLRKLLHLIL